MASFLLGLLMFALALYFRAATSHFRRAETTLSIYEDALSTVGRLSTVFSESHLNTVKPALLSPGPIQAEPGNPKGLIFASPRDSAGTLMFDPVSGRRSWQRWLAIYHDSTAQRVYECEETLSPSSLSPPVPDPFHDIEWFRTNTSAPRPMPGRVSDLSLELLPSGKTVQIKLTVLHPDRPGFSLDIVSRASFPRL